MAGVSRRAIETESSLPRAQICSIAFDQELLGPCLSAEAISGTTSEIKCRDRVCERESSTYS
jgi:hypothetical protein